MSRRRVFWLLVTLAVLVGFGLTWLAGFYTEVLWFQETGYKFVFMKVLQARATLSLLAGLFFFLVTYVNLWITVRNRQDLIVAPGLISMEPVRLSDSFRRYLLIAAVIVGILGGASAWSQWHVILARLNATPFGKRDPVFGRDVGFYVFELPFVSLIQQHLWLAVLSSLVVCSVLYLILGDIRLVIRRFVASRRARLHVAALAASLFALKIWGYQIGVWNLVYSPRGVAFGASYTDIHAQVPAFKVLMVVAAAGGVFCFLSVALRDFKWIVYSVVGLTVASFIVGYAYPSLIQQFTVSPNELAYELPFIEKNIAFTREAYALNKITQVEYPAHESLTPQQIAANPGTISNLRLWDYRVLKDTYSQVQEIRMYYKFNDVDVDRYTVNGQYREVLLSPRELDVSLLPAEAKTWINLHLKYTHGYGLVMSPASEVTRDGMPAFYFQDVPPTTNTDLVLTRPEIYFGELTNEYIIVNTKEPEFDYPRSDADSIEPTFYKGKAGIPLRSWLTRLAFMLRFRDYQVLVSGAITPESRIVMRRNIAERVRSIAPFIMWDSDPYLVLVEGKLYWIIDGYTVTASYPYSQPDAQTGVNYIRNSVKAVIDAYDGTVTLYRADEEDPILKTYEKMFPGLTRPIAEMPAGLKSHLRYPEDLFKMQTRMLTTYHMLDPRVYYNKEDYWEVPKEIYGNAESPVAPYYVVINVPGETKPEYILMTQFTPRGKPNMTAWLGARCDPERYGELILFVLPKDKLVPGPMQVESLFAQNPAISEAMTLWGQVGSQVIRGNLLTIPVDGGLLYIEPLYIQADRVKIPELKRVLMYSGGKVVMGSSVQDALNQLFGTQTGTVPTRPTEEEPVDIASLADRAARLFAEAQDKLRSGDFAGYGNTIQELGKVLSDLKELTKAR